MVDSAKVVRLQIVCPCGAQITGRTDDAKNDLCNHRNRCRACNGIEFVNTLHVYGSRSLKREMRFRPDTMREAIHVIVLHAGVILPGNVVNAAITDELLVEDPSAPDCLRLPEW